MTSKVFKLKRDSSYEGNISYSKTNEIAIHIPFQGSNSIGSLMMGVRNDEFPETIFFGADYDIINNIDYFRSDLSIQIMSKKMLTILKSIGDFKYRFLQLVMFNNKELEAYHIEEGILLEQLKERNENFIGLQLMEYTDAFDYENSVFELDDLFEDEVGYIEKLVIKKPISSFPPIFKIKEATSQIFITEQAKIALEAAGIKGCEFEEVEVSN